MSECDDKGVLERAHAVANELGRVRWRASVVAVASDCDCE